MHLLCSYLTNSLTIHYHIKFSFTKVAVLANSCHDKIGAKILNMYLQRVENVWTVVQLRLRCGGVTATATTCATRAASTTRWTDKTGRWSSPREGWWVFWAFENSRPLFTNSKIFLPPFILMSNSVTRLGDILDFGQVLKPLATINLPKSPTFLGNFVKVSKSIIFPVKSF